MWSIAYGGGGYGGLCRAALALLRLARPYLAAVKVLVTCVAGFIGSQLARRLVDQGHKVLRIDNLNRYTGEGGPDYSPVMWVEIWTHLHPQTYDDSLVLLDWVGVLVKCRRLIVGTTAAGAPVPIEFHPWNLVPNIYLPAAKVWLLERDSSGLLAVSLALGGADSLGQCLGICSVIVGVLVGWRWGTAGVAAGYSVASCLSIVIEFFVVTGDKATHARDLIGALIRPIIAAAIAASAIFLVTTSVSVVALLLESCLYLLLFMAVHAALPGGFQVMVRAIRTIDSAAPLQSAS